MSETGGLDWLPPHKCGLHLTHNEHRDYYETVEQYAGDFGRDGDWISDEERQRAIDADEVWVLQWYPDTPIGFYRVMASSLAALAAHFRSREADTPTTGET